MPEGLSKEVSLHDKVRAFLALYIVVGGLFIIGLGWVYYGIDETERMAAILLGIIGTVTGYYFGKQGVDQAQEMTNIARADREKAERLAAELDRLNRDYEKLEQWSNELEALSTAFIEMSGR